MEEGKNISRKEFLGLIGTAAVAVVVGRLVGMIESKSSVAIIKDLDTNAYGNFPYGGNKA